MAFRHAVHHGESQAGAALALGREEGLQAAAPGFLVHAHARVADFDDDAVAAVPVAARADGQRAAVRHGVHGVEHQVHQRVADLALHRGNGRQRRVQLEL